VGKPRRHQLALPAPCLALRLEHGPPLALPVQSRAARLPRSVLRQRFQKGGEAAVAMMLEVKDLCEATS
jgi:hypothetical protein